MTGAALLLAAALAAAVPAPSARPLRVMSINLCTDQLVLALLPPARIASVSWLARDPEGSLLAAAAARVPANHGLVEEVVRQRPDLVVAGTFGAGPTRALLHRLGWPLVEVPPAEDLAAIRAATRQVAAAVGERARGEALVAAMDRDLGRLARTLGAGSAPTVAAWDGAGFGAGPGSLHAALLAAAGLRNVAGGSGAPDTELLLAAAPALLVQGGRSDATGRRADTAHHPLVRRFWGSGRTLALPPATHACGTPFVAAAVRALRDQVRARAAAARMALPFARAPR